MACTTAGDPYAILSLFFTDELLATIRDHTNEYAHFELQILKEKRSTMRAWKNSTVGKLKPYMAHLPGLRYIKGRQFPTTGKQTTMQAPSTSMEE